MNHPGHTQGLEHGWQKVVPPRLLLRPRHSRGPPRQLSDEGLEHGWAAGRAPRLLLRPRPEAFGAPAAAAFRWRTGAQVGRGSWRQGSSSARGIRGTFRCRLRLRQSSWRCTLTTSTRKKSAVPAVVASWKELAMRAHKLPAVPAEEASWKELAMQAGSCRSYSSASTSSTAWRTSVAIDALWFCQRCPRGSSVPRARHGRRLSGLCACATSRQIQLPEHRLCGPSGKGPAAA